MLEGLNEALAALLASGPVGIVLAIIVFVIVLLVRHMGGIKTGDQARAAVAALAVLLNPELLAGDVEAGLTAVLTAVLAYFTHWLVGRIQANRAE